MDPVTAIGLAAAVLQFADFGVKVISKARDISKSSTGRTKLEDELLVSIGDLERVSDGVKRVLKDTQQLEKDVDLQQVIRDAEECHEDFAALLGVLHARNKDKGKALKAAVSAYRNKSQVAKVTARLNKIRTRILSSVLFSLWEAAKQSAQREVKFGGMLDDMMEVLKRLEPDTGEGRESSSTRGSESDTGEGRESLSTRGIEFDTVEGHESPSTRGSRTEAEVIWTLNRSMAGQRIYKELVETIWDRKWKPNYDGQLSQQVFDTALFRREILDTLDFNESTFREDAVDQAYHDTFSWVYDPDTPVARTTRKPLWSSFPAWLETDTTQPYWITGKPGSGKSTLMKFIQQNPQLTVHLNKWAAGSTVYTANYYAWIAGTTLQKTHEGLMRSILHQYLSWNPNLIPEVIPRRWALFKALRSCVSQPEWEELELHESLLAMLASISTSQTSKLMLFVDGLDEFDVPPAATVTLIKQMSARPGVKVCVASRPWAEFQDALYGSPIIRMQDLTSKDLELFVNAKFAESRAFTELTKIYPLETQKLLSDIVGKANGVFLWLSLVVNALLSILSEGESLAALTEAIDALPDELDALYSFIWDSVQDRTSSGPNSGVSAQILGIALAAGGRADYITFWLADLNYTQAEQDEQNIAPLSNEARSGILDVVIRRLASKTRGMVEVSLASGMVDFLHRTARDWVLQPQNWANICSSLPEDFDPYLRLTQAEASRAIVPIGQRVEAVHAQAITFRVLKYAVRVENFQPNSSKFAQIIEVFAKTMQAQTLGQGLGSWYSCMAVRSDNLLLFAAQYFLLPYLTHTLGKTDSVPDSLLSTMLEATVLDPEAQMRDNLKVPASRRRDTVILLMGQDSLRKKIRRNRRLGKKVKSHFKHEQLSLSPEDQACWQEIINILMGSRWKFWARWI